MQARSPQGGIGRRPYATAARRINRKKESKLEHLLLILALLLPLGTAAAFDHEHEAWTALLMKHIVVIDGGKASAVRYEGFARERAQLKSYLDSLSAVTRLEFDGWTKPQQLAFLINAYNAFTVGKILTRWPNLESIRDFGSFIGNPWKDSFFTLLGKPMTLDGIEHDMIREQIRAGKVPVAFLEHDWALNQAAAK